MAPHQATGDGTAGTAGAPGSADIRLVISASALGTVFEWYDFFIYGTLAASGIIGRAFFPAGNETVQTLLAWAGFAVGFGFRPLGAVVFGYLGDRLGRKYTFLATIALMGIATAGVGLTPEASAIGIAAPVIILLLRVAQGLALGGEYGGAAIYVAEHSPRGRSGFYTSFIQAGVVGGFLLSLAVILIVKAALPAATWSTWGWRIPFLFSVVLLAISLWMRLKLSESPVFQKMRAAGEQVANPIKESFTYPGNLKRMIVALFGIAAGLTVIWYTAMFTVLSFLQTTMRVEETTAQVITGVGVAAGVGWFLLFGHVSDRIGRKKPIVAGYVLTLVLLFPIFWLMGAAANPGLARAADTQPVVVHGPTCSYSPFDKVQATPCGKLLDHLSKKGVPYSVTAAPDTYVAVGSGDVTVTTPQELDAALTRAGYDLTPVRPSPGNIALILVAILAMSMLSGITYGPVAALLAEMFPPAIRYSSLSIPYHLGTGYFGGFLPFISQYIVAKTGDPYAGLWYTFAVVVMALLVTLFGLKEDRGGAAAVA
ncbi:MULTISPECIES: MFS transporter [Sphingomonas]|uniref:MFS transporter n=1 Tax=Sphingomonas TaxID=13687 RepID=UPI00082E8BD3|nr:MULTISPECIES: MFS transporter [Sphingomonas]MBY0300481.1 MFS transporter [Sphingomonas ginsenosidimutans]